MTRAQKMSGPHVRRHWEWTVDFRWLWCVHVGLSVVTDVLLWWGMLIKEKVGEGRAGRRQYMRNLCTFPSILLWTINCYKIKVLIFFLKIGGHQKCIGLDNQHKRVVFKKDFILSVITEKSGKLQTITCWVVIWSGRRKIGNMKNAILCIPKVL